MIDHPPRISVSLSLPCSHICYKLHAAFWRNFLAFIVARLEFIFFQNFCIDIHNGDLAYCNSTAISASSLTVHHQWYSCGTYGQVNAIDLPSKASLNLVSRCGLYRGLLSSTTSGSLPQNHFFKCSIDQPLTLLLIHRKPFWLFSWCVSAPSSLHSSFFRVRGIGI